VKIYVRTIVLAMLFICFVYLEAHPSTTGIQTSVIKNKFSFWQDNKLGFLKYEYLNQLPTEQNNEPNMNITIDSLKLKDPKMALFYAIIPGIIVHGAGHFYADKPVTGLILIGVEGAGLMFMMSGVVSQFNENRVSESGGIDGVVGITLFLGSWFYDLIGAPIAVNKENEDLLQQKKTSLQFQPKNGGFKVAIIYKF
jgi:hypothetical protein